MNEENGKNIYIIIVFVSNTHIHTEICFKYRINNL